VAQPARATAAQPAVAAEQVGIRDYRRRLSHFRSKDPFKQHFQLPAAPSSALEGMPASGGVSGGSAAGAATTPPTSSSLPTGGQTTTPESSPAPAPPTTTTSGGTTTTHTHRITRLLTRKVDVKVGLPGQMRTVHDVGALDVLPTAARPMLSFLGVSDNGKQAAFLVTTNVASETGDGRCIPDRTTCQYIAMKPKDVESFVYTPNGQTYRLKLVDIHWVTIGHGPSKSDDSKSLTNYR
jgi:hypothetical protein